MSTLRMVRTAITAGLAGGLLDIVYACIASAVRSGRAPGAVLQSVASGWLGKAAYEGGAATAALGLVTHFGIAITMAAVYGVAATRLAVLRERPWLAGPIYGLGLYLVMYHVVLPLRFPEVFPRFSGWLTVTDLIVHAGVGLIIALVVSAGLRQRSA
jgi:hypothetical protein